MSVRNQNIKPTAGVVDQIDILKVNFSKASAPVLADFEALGSFTEIPAGTIYYDSVGNTVYFRNGSSGWTALGGAAGGTFDLDTAYNNGRTITADDTAITLTHSHATALLFDINRTGTGSGAAIDIAHAGATTGTAVNLDMTNAVAARALIVTLAGTRTGNGILLTHTGTGSTDVIECNISSTPSGAFLDLNVSGAVTGSLLDIAQSAATTGHVIKIVDSAATTGDFLNADKGDTGTPTGNGLTLDMGADVAGHTISLLATNGARSGHDLLITDGTGAHTGSAIAIVDPSTRSVPVLSIVTSGAITGNIIDITNTGAVTGHFLSIAYGNSGVATGDAINIHLGVGVAASALTIAEGNGTRSDHRISITTGTGAHSGSTMAVADNSTGSVPMFDIDFSGVYTGHCIDITYGTAAATGNAIDLNMGTNLAGNGLDISRSGVATGKGINISHAGASTGDSILVTLTNTTACKALNVAATVAHTVSVINVDSSGVLADNVGCVEIDHSTGNLIAGSALLRVDSDMNITNAAYGVEITLSAATAAIGLNVNGGAVARTSNLVEFVDLSTSTTGAALSITAATTGQTAINVASGKVKLAGRFQLGKGTDVASAGDLVLAGNGNVFHITGTTTINAVTTTNWQAGSMVTFIFDGSVTVKHNIAGGANTAVMLLAAAGDFSATANDTLTLVYDGTSWFEVCRTVI